MEEKNSFAQLLEKNRIPIERYIHYRIPTPHDAEDVIQETYLAAFRHFSELRSQTLFKQWMLQIAKNQCNLWFRNTHRHSHLSLDMMDSMEYSFDSPQGGSVQEILRNLPPESAEILTAYYLGGKSQAEIAHLNGIPLGTVKSRLFHAKKRFRSACPPEIKRQYEKGDIIMKEKTKGFPLAMPIIKIEKSFDPFFEVKCEDWCFIIPRVGNSCSEGTYRYPDKRLLMVSTCRVPKKAYIHGTEGVKICRDTYNVNTDRFVENEAIWFVQLTETYYRNLAEIKYDDDDELPTSIYTFLEEDYDVIVNGSDRIHGMPILIKENPVTQSDGRILIQEYNTRYTMGRYHVTIGTKCFDTIKCLVVQKGTLAYENFIDKDGRLILMRWYETKASLENNDAYPASRLACAGQNDAIVINGEAFFHVEDRISEYALPMSS